MSLFDKDIVQKQAINATVLGEITKKIVIFLSDDEPVPVANYNEIDETIDDILMYLYYRAKAGMFNAFGADNSEIYFHAFNIKYDFVEGKFKGDGQEVIDYIINRFNELGFEVTINPNRGVIELHWKCDIDIISGPAFNVYSKTIASDLIPVIPMSQPTGLSILPSIMLEDSINPLKPTIGELTHKDRTTTRTFSNKNAIGKNIPHKKHFKNLFK